MEPRETAAARWVATVRRAVHPGSQPEGADRFPERQPDSGPRAAVPDSGLPQPVTALWSRAGLVRAAVSVLRADGTGLLGDALGSPTSHPAPQGHRSFLPGVIIARIITRFRARWRARSQCQSREAGFQTAAVPASQSQFDKEGKHSPS